MSEIFSTTEQQERYEHGIVLYHAGYLDEAERAFLCLLGELRSTDFDARLVVANGLAMLERAQGRHRKSLTLLMLSNAIAAQSGSHLALGKYHHGLAVTHHFLATEAGGDGGGHVEQAYRAYTAARFHFQRAPSCALYLLHLENNIAALLIVEGKTGAALAHLQEVRARLEAEDAGLVALAQVDDTIADALLNLNRLAEAEEIITRSIRALTGTGETLALDQSTRTLKRIRAAMGAGE